jgi:hypothetical protein
MDRLFIKLKEFWGQFKNPYTKKAVPAFREGYVIVKQSNTWKEPVLPYIVYQVVDPGFTGNALISVTIWDKPKNPGEYPVVNAVIEQISKIITEEEGVVLTLENGAGAVWLMRGSPFVTYPPGDPSDFSLVRGVLNLIIRGYML